jgi:hypothetical protein|tara:strand:- start:11 stop:445 length:435 start_codon:yes stop_codon:yes gene_type:complete
MAITYENVIYDRVIDSLQTILANEFSIPVLFDDTAERGNQSFLITPAGDDLEEPVVTGQVRNYTVSINYELRSAGNYTKNSVKQVTEITERLKRLLYNNRTYSVSGTNRFYNGSVNTIAYERDEDDPGIIRSITSLTVTTMELI